MIYFLINCNNKIITTKQTNQFNFVYDNNKSFAMRITKIQQHFRQCSFYVDKINYLLVLKGTKTMRVIHKLFRLDTYDDGIL